MVALDVITLLPPAVRYKIYLWLGLRKRSSGDMDAARQLLERAAILFPDRSEAQTYLEDVRRQLGRTKVDSVTAEPVLPLRPEQFREGQEYRGITTGNIWRIDKRLGEGSMGVVFRVMNKAADTGTSYALKTFKTAEAWQE